MISSTYVGVAGLTNPSPSCCLLDRALPGEEEQSSVCAHKQTVTQTASWEGRLTAHDSLVCEDEVEVGFLFVSSSVSPAPLSAGPEPLAAGRVPEMQTRPPTPPQTVLLVCV